jgi:bifunctional DNase/RNase
MIPIELAKIIIDERNPDQVVVLKEKNGPRQVPIVIGFMEVTSIQMRISGAEPPRPLTHDLLASVIRSLGAEVEYLLIDDLVDGTFFAKLHVKNAANGPADVDCRPSDGIALAVRLAIPMFVDEKVFKKSAASE